MTATRLSCCASWAAGWAPRSRRAWSASCSGSRSTAGRSSTRRAGVHSRGSGKKRSEHFKDLLSTTLVTDPTTRLMLLNLVTWGAAGLVMVWTHQKYWQDNGVPLAYFGVLFASYNLIFGVAERAAAF